MSHFVWMRELEAEVWTKWRGLVSEQAQSGQSAAKFCSDRGLRVWQFYEWKKRLVDSEGAKFVSVEVKPAELAMSSFVPVSVGSRTGAVFCRFSLSVALRFL
jgi:hypothetical protein